MLSLFVAKLLHFFKRLYCYFANAFYLFMHLCADYGHPSNLVSLVNAKLYDICEIVKGIS